ncbi:MAG: hypothetical protein WCI89_02950 [bacterium]
MISSLRAWFSQHVALLLVVFVAVALTSVPWFEAWFFSAGAFHWMPLTYADEFIYYSHMHEVATGNLFFGNPYFLEHRFDPPLALFGSSVLAALPMLFGLPLVPTLLLNFVLWGGLFVVLCYWLLREFGALKWVSALIVLFVYIQSYDLIFRASVQQEVFPFFLLFYIALIRFLKNKSNIKSTLWLGAATGVTFYLYGYLWQLALATLGFLVLYALVQKDWPLFARSLKASCLGLLIGAPAFIYTVWITHQPYFWESMDRWGLVHTHLPVAEVIYSGGWVGLVLAFLFFIRLKIPQLKTNPEFFATFLFLCVTGLGLWVTQGSNLITGQMLELGEHLRVFIVPWLALVTTLSCWTLWSQRAYMSKKFQIFSGVMLCVLLCANLVFAYEHLSRFVPSPEQRALWAQEQSYAGPLRWLDAHEPSPVVVWGDPHNELTTYVPALTRQYVLFEQFGQFNLLSNDEFYERYLVSQYFNNPDAAQLKADFGLYIGRSKQFHYPKTLEREVKLCRLLHFYQSDRGSKTCGTVPSPTELLGDAFFNSLETKFQKDIKPNIKTYLKKYHVSYILKDTQLDPQYRPEALGAARVYTDGKFEIYTLPPL